MFVNACTVVHETIYGIVGLTQASPAQVNWSNGTGFMIAPGVIATAAHGCHLNGNVAHAVHQHFEVIRAPDIGQPPEPAVLLAEDTDADVALLRIAQPRSDACLALHVQPVPRGTSCGSLGFPLASLSFTATGRMFNVIERFQGASVSALLPVLTPTGRQVMMYETDALMYSGSSGCPGFLVDARVFGLQVRSVVEQAGTPAPGANQQAPPSSQRLSISIWTSAAEIRNLATNNNVVI
jgi:hypothetical protein